MKYTIDPVEDGVLLIGCTNHHYKVTVKKDLKYANKINRWTSLDFRNIWRVEDELDLYPSLSEAIDRAKEILKKKNIMKNSFYKIRAKYRTENVENDVVEGYEVYSTSIDDEDITACFFSSEIYGTEEAYKKASEAKEELCSWQYERR